MKRLSILMAALMMLSTLATCALAETATYTQSPYLDAAVEAGELPPVEERLPDAPRLVKEMTDEDLDLQVGNYGGTLRLVTSVVNWDADVFVGNDEALLTCESVTSENITPNIVEDYSVNEDNTVFTFTLRKGLKWSDGAEVTMADFEFGINDFVFNQELTPAVSAYMCEGGVTGAEPFAFEVLDDTHFTIAFKSSYGGFPLHLSIVGWKGYTDMLKPAHYLKKFHKDYAVEIHGSEEAYWEFMQPYAEAMGYDDASADNTWTYIFHQVDMTNWELTDPIDALTTVTFEGLVDTNFPVLYPWVMTGSNNGVITWERNPYYFKVDAEGQQLPYFDKVTSTLVEDMEMVQMNIITGQVDYARESGTIANISLYRENEESAGIKAYPVPQIVNTSIGINYNYGMNPDGTVKDDEASRAWQEALSYPEFTRALEISIDAEEVVDAVYNGFAAVNPYFDCTNDIEGANELLDGAGFKDVDGDGYRETPSGLTLQWQFWNKDYLPDQIPCIELWVEYWREIGLKVDIYTTEDSLLDTSLDANEVPMEVLNLHSTQTWFQADYGNRDNVLWNAWASAGGLIGELKEGAYVEPPQAYIDQLSMINSLFLVSPSEAINEVVPRIMANCQENHWIIEPVIDMMTVTIVNEDIGNMPTGGNSIAGNFAMEQLYYESFQYEAAE